VFPVIDRTHGFIYISKNSEEETVKKKKKWYFIGGGIAFFVLYIFAAAQPVHEETVLTHRWISSLVSAYPVEPEKREGIGRLIPFQLGNRFGYVDKDGNFTVNQVKIGRVSLSESYWAEYPPAPSRIEVRNPLSGEVLPLEKAYGYPLFLDEQIFLINSEQNAVSAFDSNGNLRWVYEFPATLTCIDAVNGLFLAGTLDGVVEILNAEGRRVFSFVPGGSRVSLIAGCAFSKDGSQFAVISGLDEQRFLFMERLGASVDNEYRVAYHEFLGEGFRRPVHIAFVDDGRRVAFERENGLGVYDIAGRKSSVIPIKGEIIDMDESGNGRLFFFITAQEGNLKRFGAVQFPDDLMFEAPFKSESAFLGRQNNTIFFGGGVNLAAFEITKK
jgi:hypothetical protein